MIAYRTAVVDAILAPGRKSRVRLVLDPKASRDDLFVLEQFFDGRWWSMHSVHRYEDDRLNGVVPQMSTPYQEWARQCWESPTPV